MFASLSVKGRQYAVIHPSGSCHPPGLPSEGRWEGVRGSRPTKRAYLLSFHPRIQVLRGPSADGSPTTGPSGQSPERRFGKYFCLIYLSDIAVHSLTADKQYPYLSVSVFVTIQIKAQKPQLYRIFVFRRQ